MSAVLLVGVKAFELAAQLAALLEHSLAELSAAVSAVLKVALLGDS